MDQLEDAGIIGPQQGAGPRPIIMDQAQLEAILNGENGTVGEQGPDDGAEPTGEGSDDTQLTEEQQ